MVSLDEAVVARLDRHGIRFEILVDPEQAHKVKADTPDDAVLGVLAADGVFLHARDGERAPEEDLQKGFDTADTAAVARRILTDGEIQLTQEQRKKMQEDKHKRVLDSICRNAWNPQTKTPHPKDRIERALDEAGFRIDPLRPVSEQVSKAVKMLRPLLPIAVEQVKVAVKVPAEHTGAAYGPLRELGDLQKEEWQNDGTLIAVLEIPAGAQGELYERLNALTHGSVETRLLS